MQKNGQYGVLRSMQRIQGRSPGRAVRNETLRGEKNREIQKSIMRFKQMPQMERRIQIFGLMALHELAPAIAVFLMQVPREVV
jgi:hypothetical protein